MQVLITGANRGIGAALDNAFAARGVSVLGTARDHRNYLPLEVTDPASHSALAERLKGQAIDALVCNAGIYPDKGQTLDDGYPADMWAQTFAVNGTGVFLTVQALLPNLLLSDKPRIAIISSQMASQTRAPGGSYIYRASKAAALNLGRNLAADLKPRGVAVGIYHPGWVRTDMGGSTADITVDEAAQGLVERIDALSIGTTGCFETWDGRAHPY
ncbi:SDR family oxidoreductase [Antarctobacter heliothermus]|uniref:NADP-dependent 3-hydroxy acid dehydrogenase YdfG n=1 Tax=Antarctobacter heliothermus TaxID=74033 RepID=A0A239CJE1_9RHOB|nr:SDR family oxidoreductase [Antarctobacter heliothermus]SNS20059.1 NADP-dependent 3-hydroxy acid dehydrogenase YdfG [Antarctobacter heliothermus]